MSRYYENIIGWFDFQDIYLEAISKSNNNDILIEIGSFLGKSACFMLEEIEKSGKNLQFYCVDTWDLTKDDQFLEINIMPGTNKKYVDIEKELGKDFFYHDFLKNINNCPGKQNFKKAIRNFSWDAASEFKDDSCFFIFIDAGHSYESLTKDLKSWYPKVKKHGIFAGHDFISGESIRKGINDFCLANNIEFVQRGASWFIIKH